MCAPVTRRPSGAVAEFAPDVVPSAPARRRPGGQGWGVAVAVVLAGPALAWLLRAGPQPLGHEASVVTGLLAMSAMVVTVVLPSRVRGLTRAFGLETVLGLHRRLGVLTGVAIALHLACVVADEPVRVSLLVPILAPGRGQAAMLAVVAVAALLMLAMRRRGSPRRSHEVWRWMHLCLAAVTVGASALHVLWLDRLVEDPVMGPVLAGLGTLLLAVLVLRWGVRGPMDRVAGFRVREVRAESPTVSTIVLDRRRRHGGPWFRPGQFAWLRLERCAVEEHPFTIASSAQDRTAVEFTVRHVGDFAARLRRLAPGAAVWVDGPHGAFTPDGVPGSGLVLIAGGIGITPMMSMLRTAADRGDTRPYRLVVHARGRDDLLFRAELTDLGARMDLQVTEVLSHPVSGWGGATGPVDVGLLAAVLTDLDTPHRRLDYFVCGRPSLVGDVLDTMRALGVPEHRVHTEQFVQI